MNKPILALFTLSPLLLGCQANDDSLSDFIRQVENQARYEVTTLSPRNDYQVVLYQPEVQREPFELPQEALIATQPVVRKDCWQPGARKRPGKLERFPLEHLRLKGVMTADKTVSGLIQAPDGAVHRVLPGQYLGQNRGKITIITSSYLLVSETLPDGLGCWQTRKVKLALR
ncbi:pilus assembly protein PilP [Vibrio sp. CAU 1672]|uniref:pilus assembly protein PilP n=1 Tax=Vibrio sp. CAU 1672 TaxID=3032594 RepID=UPI0023DCBBF4|nr:pilus assembly protein PilP [Vibrio sp. CAU 1672]MDF2155677.1 pilus assembly protein PilP [Vibrio sp. CAU 1672]